MYKVAVCIHLQKKKKSSPFSLFVCHVVCVRTQTKNEDWLKKGLRVITETQVRSPGLKEHTGHFVTRSDRRMPTPHLFFLSQNKHWNNICWQQEIICTGQVLFIATLVQVKSHSSHWIKFHWPQLVLGWVNIDVKDFLCLVSCWYTAHLTHFNGSLNSTNAKWCIQFSHDVRQEWE